MKRRAFMAMLLLCSLLATVCPSGGAEPQASPLREFFGNGDAYSLYQGALPCVGSPKILVFVIDFAGDNTKEHPWKNYSLSDIKKHFFDDRGKTKPKRANDSLRGFYYRASYGKLDITGDVIAYTTEKPKSEYPDPDSIILEVMNTAGREDALDWSQYDANGDQHIDGVYFALRTYPAFDTSHFVARADYTRGGKSISQLAFLSGLGINPTVESLAHETCHMLGLPDVYANVGLNTEGTGVNSIMDGPDFMSGDLFGIMKVIFGWITPQHIDTLGETEVTLSSLSDKPDLAIVYPRADRKGLHWFVVEYITRTKNNLDSPVKKGGGLRIWRVTMDEQFFGDDFFPFNSPYLFLETVHPAGVRDYFFYPGDSFTPFTELSSNVPQSLQLNGDGSVSLEGLRDSGIYLENLRIVDGQARFTVTIRGE